MHGDGGRILPVAGLDGHVDAAMLAELVTHGSQRFQRIEGLFHLEESPGPGGTAREDHFGRVAVKRPEIASAPRSRREWAGTLRGESWEGEGFVLGFALHFAGIPNP